jgi:NhaP-type Na+/H+ or K+/H+ antiporter
MATVNSSSSARLLAALLVAGTLSLGQPVTAMEVTIGQVDTSIQTSGTLGASTIKLLVKKVKQSLDEQAQDERRRQQEQQPQRPQ